MSNVATTAMLIKRKKDTGNFLMVFHFLQQNIDDHNCLTIYNDFFHKAWGEKINKTK